VVGKFVPPVRLDLQQPHVEAADRVHVDELGLQDRQLASEELPVAGISRLARIKQEECSEPRWAFWIVLGADPLEGRFLLLVPSQCLIGRHDAPVCRVEPAVRGCRLQVAAGDNHIVGEHQVARIVLVAAETVVKYVANFGVPVAHRPMGFLEIGAVMHWVLGSIACSFVILAAQTYPDTFRFDVGKVTVTPQMATMSMALLVSIFSSITAFQGNREQRDLQRKMDATRRAIDLSAHLLSLAARVTAAHETAKSRFVAHLETSKALFARVSGWLQRRFYVDDDPAKLRSAEESLLKILRAMRDHTRSMSIKLTAQADLPFSPEQLAEWNAVIASQEKYIGELEASPIKDRATYVDRVDQANGLAEEFMLLITTTHVDGHAEMAANNERAHEKLRSMVEEHTNSQQ
jgi:hypothetical protein